SNADRRNGHAGIQSGRVYDDGHSARGSKALTTNDLQLAAGRFEKLTVCGLQLAALNPRYER
ncbi:MULTISPECIES: hypothetical protein, partial [Pseudomonas syringae group genomosp. 2]